jgi:hypothetical protein
VARSARCSRGRLARNLRTGTAPSLSTASQRCVWRTFPRTGGACAVRSRNVRPFWMVEEEIMLMALADRCRFWFYLLTAALHATPRQSIAFLHCCPPLRDPLSPTSSSPHIACLPCPCPSAPSTARAGRQAARDGRRARPNPLPPALGRRLRPQRPREHLGLGLDVRRLTPWRERWRRGRRSRRGGCGAAPRRPGLLGGALDAEPRRPRARCDSQARASRADSAFGMRDEVDRRRVSVV